MAREAPVLPTGDRTGRAGKRIHGFRFFADNGFDSFLALGSIFLVVTGGEALYADMGHFGRAPIARGWFTVALPTLALSYFGQGSLLLGEPSAIESPFYRMAPSMLLFVVLREQFRWPTSRAAALCAGFGVIDLAFFLANVLKIPAGGWFPLLIATGMFTMMTTWRTGRRLVGERLRHGHVSLEDFFASLGRAAVQPQTVPGTAVYLFSAPGFTPPALQSNVRHNDALHRHIVIPSITTMDEPRVAPADRAEVTHIRPGVDQVVLRYGFMEEPDVLTGLSEGSAGQLGIDGATASFFLGAESLVVTRRAGMARWREHLFAFMNRNAAPAVRSFGLPPDHTVTLGQQVLL